MESQKLLKNCQKIQKGCYLNFKSCYLNSLYSLYSSLFALTNLALNSCSHIKVVSNHSFLFMEMNQQRQPSCHLCRRFSRLPVLILDNRPPKHLRNCIDRSNFFQEIVDFIVLDVCSKSKSCQKNCSERQKLLKVVRTTRSFSQRQTLLKSFREQSGQALSEGRKQEYVKFWGSGDTCCLMI